tara:strand:+ start:272 stop:1393 length:1122 start_codon:yes stop_codon:yes gene_type:complete
MKKYINYDIEDFIQDDEFRDWVKGNSKRKIFWVNFIKNHPEKGNTIRQAEMFIRATQIEIDELSDREIRHEVERFLDAALQDGSFNQGRNTVQSPLRNAFLEISRFLNWQVAAAIIVFCLIGAGIYRQFLEEPFKEAISQNSDIEKDGLVITTNNSEKPLLLVLADSSEVILSPTSSLKYPAVFKDSARAVYLQGEASFSVRRQARPFFVHTGEMVTKVLGTRFVVNAYEKDKKYTVQVISGKVSVYQADPNRKQEDKAMNGLILTANQAAIFEKEMHQLVKSLVANPIVVGREIGTVDLRYEDVPLPQILKEFERNYGITIQFDEQNFQKCAITATLSNESLYEKLDAICKTIDANYDIVDGQIMISGKGCR